MTSGLVSFLATLLPQLFVGGALFSLLSVLLTRRAEGRKLSAETRKADAETDSEFVATARSLVTGLREELEVQRLLIVELQERVRLADKQVAVFTRQTGRLTSDLLFARAELVAARADLARALDAGGRTPPVSQ